MAFPSLNIIESQRHMARRQSEDARQYAYRMIKACILELILKPGQKMNEADIAASLNISRTPVHDTFIKLERENLTDIVPQRGAFVSKIDTDRIRQAVWLHSKLGTSMLQTIFIKNVPKNQLEILYFNPRQLEDYLKQGNFAQSARLLTDYYYQLYVLAGNMDIVWDALQKADVDLRRLLYLAVSSPAVVNSFVCELENLTDALVKRDSDLACSIYIRHLSRMLMLLPSLEKHNPGYFIPLQDPR